MPDVNTHHQSFIWFHHTRRNQHSLHVVRWKHRPLAVQISNNKTVGGENNQAHDPKSTRISRQKSKLQQLCTKAHQNFAVVS